MFIKCYAQTRKQYPVATQQVRTSKQGRKMIASKTLISIVIIAVALKCRAKKCYKDDGSPSRCMPKFINAAYLKDISANNTCGTVKPSLYCVQSERSGHQMICEVCDARFTKLAHPANYMNDLSFDTRWQSDSLFTNKYSVRIILDLGKTFDVTFIRLVFYSPRPHSFAIYKKISTAKGANWKPFQYYSRECRKSYGVLPNQIISRANQKIALCSERFSEITPLSNGNVAFSTLFGRPDQFRYDSSLDLQVILG